MHPAKRPYCMHKLRWRRYLMSKFRKYCGNMKYENQAIYRNMNIKEKLSRKSNSLKFCIFQRIKTKVMHNKYL